MKMTAVVGAALLVAVVVGGWLWSVLGTAIEAPRRGAPIAVDEALLSTAAAVSLAVLGWLTLGVVLEAAALVPGQVGRVARRVSAAVSPVVVRRAATLLLGATLGAALSPGVSMASTGTVVGSAIGVTASPGPGASVQESQPTTGPPDSAFATLPDPGFGPTGGPAPETSTAPDAWSEAIEEPFVAEPPVVRAQPDVSAVAAADRRAPDDVADAGHEVVVHRGDSLWSIAARHLGQDPSDAQIADEWPRWYAANRAVIGADPDLLLAGQVLTVPGGTRP